jgi:hypothetical protein
MMQAVKMGSGGMIYVTNFMMIGSGFYITIRLLPQQFER